MRTARGAVLAALALAAAGTFASAGGFVTEQDDGRSPTPWRRLDAQEHARFELGHAVFNTGWAPAGKPAGRRDGLGPHFNAASCDACHNSRRRGRGPDGDGIAPADLVMQVGRRDRHGGVVRGHPLFGDVANTAAVEGVVPEAEVSIRYRLLTHLRPDGTTVVLRQPAYAMRRVDGAPLPHDLVLMPRMPPSVQGAGLLEEVPESAITGTEGEHDPRTGEPSWLAGPAGRQLGRYGWQATQPTLELQIASAFANEMGLTTSLHEEDDSGDATAPAVRDAGAAPEVEDALFEAVVAFQRWETARRPPHAARALEASAQGSRLFEQVGCADCHRHALPVRSGGFIAAYTDLRLHDLGPDLADRDIRGRPVPSRWRTAPLWGLATATEGRRRLRLLHDGRAHGVEEAIAWHGGEAGAARLRFDRLDAGKRQQLVDWVSSL